ncbi:MAG: HAD family hydrolase [Desulfobacteraceae bacterium]|nr:HAD family hydrolase [Desulfobacteraceae bacterium]
MKRAIIFDFGQTLANSADGFRAAEKEAEREIYACLRTDSWDSFVSVYRDVRKEFHGKSEFSRRSMWAEVFRRFGEVPAEAMLETLESRYWETVQDRTLLFPEAVSTIKRLSRKYGLGMVTNTQGQPGVGKHRLGRFPELEHRFDSIIVAGESGIPPKPDEIPFRLSVGELGVLPEEAVFVGDDLRIDIQGALAVGIDPVWLKHYSVSRSWPDVPAPCPVITSLDQLVALENIFPAS